MANKRKNGKKRGGRGRRRKSTSTDLVVRPQGQASAVMMNPNRGTRSYVQRGLSPSNMAMLKGMCNPWSAESIGCKYPDGLGTRTIAIQYRGLYTFTTLAGGNALWVVTPSLPYQGNGCTYAAPNYTFAATYGAIVTSSLAQTLLNNGATYRPVCGGITIRGVQNVTDSYGTVIITKLGQPPTSGTTWATGTLQGESRAFPIVAGFEKTVLFKPVGNAGYSFVGGSTAATPNKGWDAILIEVTGAKASSQVFTIDYCVNYEFELDQTSQATYAQFATPTPPDNPLVKKAVNTAWNSVSSIFDRGMEYAGKKLITAASRAIFGPAGGAAAMIMDVD